MAPMDWKPRTLKKSGQCQKVIKEQTPPGLFLQDHETCNELGKNSFWPEDVERSESTL